MDIILFSQKLKDLRNEKGLTQQQLADRLGVVKSTVAHYESGDKLPSYDTLIRLARIYAVTTDYLLGIDKTSDSLDLSSLSVRDANLLRHIQIYMREQPQDIR